MGRSQETFNKKEVKNKKEKKRKDKELKRARKKSDGKKSSFEDMIAYVDEFGKISSTPSNPSMKAEIAAEDIRINVPRNTNQAAPDFVRKGVVTFFNTSKNYGFIKDMESHESIFVHSNNLIDPIKENNIVEFEIGRGPKGLSAMKVKLVK